MTPEDTRNLVDDLKGKSEQEIIAALDANGVALHIAIENVERDFNMGSIVRSANAFGVRHVHVIGRRQWNKRGAMATDRYLHVHYHDSAKAFSAYISAQPMKLIAIDNVPGAHDMVVSDIPFNAVLIFGSESSGISDELRAICDEALFIRQKGSTRSLNVAAAAAVAMYEWSRRHLY
jgi:tRNA G18 (ribose-2'-O)-methylase SpoU